MAPTKRARLQSLDAQLTTDRASYDSHWKDLGENYAPRRMRWYEGDRNQGSKRHNKIINGHGLLSARTLRSGMFTGITSPARPWRRLTTPDPELAEFSLVKRWLHTVNKRLDEISLRCNLYNVLPTLFGDLGIFGTSAVACMDDFEDLMRFYSFPLGSYWLARDARGRVDTFMRKFQLSVRQCVTEYGDPTATGEKRWQNFSPSVKAAWDRGNYEDPVNVTWIIYPNDDYDPQALEARYKRFASCTFETGAPGASLDEGLRSNRFLRESGFDLFPILGPVWQRTGEDNYGTNCPGMEALGDVKELQVLEKKKSRAIEKQVNPSLVGPPSLRTVRVSLLPGDITYATEAEGQKGLRSIHETNLSVRDVTFDIEKKEQRISRLFYEDLFLMLTQLEGIQPRNERELAERHEEKLLALGEVLEQVNDDVLDPLTDLQIDKLNRLGLLPPAPRELRDMPLRVEYVSIMHQAQKLVGISGTERFIFFVKGLAELYPEVKQKVDPDQAVEDMHDRLGVSAKLLVPTETVEVRRAAIARAQQRILDHQMAEDAINRAKTLSDTNTAGDNALREVAGAATR